MGLDACRLWVGVVLKLLPGAADLRLWIVVLAASNPSYLALGFITQDSDSTKTGASNTLEYAYDDGVLANIAAYLGYPDDASTFHNRSMFYKWGPNPMHVHGARGASWSCKLGLQGFGLARGHGLCHPFPSPPPSPLLFPPESRNVFDASTLFVCPRYANGSFACPWPEWIYPFEKTYVEVGYGAGVPAPSLGAATAAPPPARHPGPVPDSRAGVGALLHVRVHLCTHAYLMSQPSCRCVRDDCGSMCFRGTHGSGSGLYPTTRQVLCPCTPRLKFLLTAWKPS